MDSPSPGWPPELDAVIAAPKHHRILLENDLVRVLDTRIEPGQTVPLHTHRWFATYYIISWSDFVRRDAHGNVQLDTRATGTTLLPGMAIWGNPLDAHTIEVVGDAPLQIISIELKQST